MAKVLPRFDEMADAYRGADGKLNLPDSVNARTLLQQATREILTAGGLDVSELTDIQMSDNQFHLIFPNLFITIRAGEATAIISMPHPDGNPNRCVWHSASYQWLKPEDRAGQRAPLVEIAEGEHEPYFLALEQDYVQMQNQQRGLRNRSLKEMVLTRQEVRLAHFHAVLDKWLAQPATP
jgi:hypothetical protein